MAQERLRMEKFFVEMSRHSGSEREIDNKSPSIAASQNVSLVCAYEPWKMLMSFRKFACNFFS